MNLKHLLFILSALLLIASLSSLISKPASAAGYTDITVLQAKTMIDTNPSLVVLDVRNQSEYVTGHIRNAKLIPLFELNTSLNQLNTADEILVYCLFGGRSMTASQILASNGFLHIYNMLGGITDWTREQYPTYVRYASIQEAIDSATDGNILYISSGQYSEHLIVNRSLSLIGENKDTTIIDGTQDGTVFYVNADNVSISDFKMQYSGCSCTGYFGIDIESDHQNINMTNNNIFSNSYGIQIKKAQNIIIIHNNITYSRDFSIAIQGSTEILVSENNIVNNLNRIDIENSTQITLINNNITNNSDDGVALTNSNNTTIIGNIITSNVQYGLYVSQSNNNTIFHNSFQSNGRHVSIRNSTFNFWDNGFEGNYWSNYTGTDTDNDGIGDTPHTIDSENIDNYPLIGMFLSYHTSQELDVNVISNSTIDSFEYFASNGIKLQVSNTTANQMTGFCRISIPHALIDPDNGTIQVTIDNGQTHVAFLNTTLYDNGTHRWIYLSYQHSTHEILIVPEYLQLLTLPLLMTVTILAAAIQRKRHLRSSAR